MAGFEIGMSRFYENAFCALHVSIIPKADTTELRSVSLSIPTLTHGVFRGAPRCPPGDKRQKSDFERANHGTIPGGILF